jgi:hypothetical protein
MLAVEPEWVKEQRRRERKLRKELDEAEKELGEVRRMMFAEKRTEWVPKPLKVGITPENEESIDLIYENIPLSERVPFETFKGDKKKTAKKRGD